MKKVLNIKKMQYPHHKIKDRQTTGLVCKRASFILSNITLAWFQTRLTHHNGAKCLFLKK